MRLTTPAPLPNRSNRLTWATSDRIRGTDAFFAAQAGLTVRTILTPRADFRTCGRDDLLSQVIDPDMEFDFLPVDNAINEHETIIVGLLDTRALRAAGQDPDPNLRVGSRTIPLDERHVIGAAMSILDFLQTAEAQPCRLVVDAGRIVGLVSLSDIQRLPVRPALFGLVTGLEMAMTEVIAIRLPEASWKELLEAGPRKRPEREIKKAHTRDTYVDELLLTYISDKAAILLASSPDKASQERLTDIFDRICKLRNAVSHANDYAPTLEAARNVCRTVCDMVDLRHSLEAEAQALRPPVS